MACDVERIYAAGRKTPFKYRNDVQNADPPCGPDVPTATRCGGPILLASRALAARKLIKRGDVVWDIGANIDLFSLAAAVCAGDQGELSPSSQIRGSCSCLDERVPAAPTYASKPHG
jgi:hypothetical protein